MERESAKHSPRIDEQMKVQGRRDAEKPSTDDLLPGEGMADAVNSNIDYAETAAALPDGEVEARSELARYAKPAEWPADKAQLLDIARADAAPDRVIDRLSKLPDGERFDNVARVWEATGGSTEGPHA